MANSVDIGYISAILNNPAFLEARLVIVSNEKGWRGYISGDSEKLFECCGNTVESVFSELSEWCERITNE